MLFILFLIVSVYSHQVFKHLITSSYEPLGVAEVFKENDLICFHLNVGSRQMTEVHIHMARNIDDIPRQSYMFNTINVEFYWKDIIHEERLCRPMLKTDNNCIWVSMNAMVISYFEGTPMKHECWAEGEFIDAYQRAFQYCW
jgi:hypothetical protein